MISQTRFKARVPSSILVLGFCQVGAGTVDLDSFTDLQWVSDFDLHVLYEKCVYLRRVLEE
jgi:hypothetical protein